MGFLGYLWIHKLHYHQKHVLLKGSNWQSISTQNSYAPSQQEEECQQYLEQKNKIPYIRA